MLNTSVNSESVNLASLFYCVKILLILTDTIKNAHFLALKHENYGNFFSLSPF